MRYILLTMASVILLNLSANAQTFDTLYTKSLGG